jgi:predicted transcriptional regulator
MNNEDLDIIFSILENPIRRKILAKLAKEQHYPLQLSKELNISQQAIMKHLKVLEDNKLVVSFEEKSTLGGPPRKSYISNKHISLRIDVGPNTFNTEIYDYKEIEDKISDDLELKTEDRKVEVDKFKDFEEQYKEIKTIQDPSKKLTELSKVIQDMDKELEELKLKRVKLLNIREEVVHESNRLIGELCREYNERKILYYLLSHKEREVSDIAEALDLRERVIMDLFKHLIKQRILLDSEDDFI